MERHIEDGTRRGLCNPNETKNDGINKEEVLPLNNKNNPTYSDSATSPSHEYSKNIIVSCPDLTVL